MYPYKSSCGNSTILVCCTIDALIHDTRLETTIMMKKRQLLLLLAMLSVIAIAILGLKPSSVWSAEHRLIGMIQSQSPHHSTLLAQKTPINQRVVANQQLFTLHAIYGEASQGQVCFIHSVQTTSPPQLGDRVEQSKQEGGIYVREMDATSRSVDGRTLGLATDAVDTAAFFTCFDHLSTGTAVEVVMGSETTQGMVVVNIP
jgi:hypothetical protein